MADDANRQLIEARRLVNSLVRVCRQTLVFFDGASAMDKPRVQRLLRDTIRDCEQFLNPRQ